MVDSSYVMEGVEVPRLPMTSAYDEVYFKGGSPGLVVMGEDSCSEGRGFESQRRILDEHNIFHIYLL